MIVATYFTAISPSDLLCFDYTDIIKEKGVTKVTLFKEYSII
jgi:hypothetical protein